MSSQSLRDALEKRLGALPVMAYGNGYMVEALPKAELMGLLAAHPAEPAPVVPDEAVEAGVASFERVPEKQGAVDDTDGQFRDAMRAALEAAVPLLGPLPLLDREALAAMLHDQHAGHEWGSRGCQRAGTGCAKRYRRDADAVVELARPMPTREQIAETFAAKYTEPLDIANRGEDWTYPERSMSDRIQDDVMYTVRVGEGDDCGVALKAPTCLEIADVVLALLSKGAGR